MTDYIYSTEGRPHGFRLNGHIHDMEGRPVGRVCAEKVYTLNGEYVGAIINNMVVDKPGLSKRSLPARSRPKNVTVPAGAGDRRPIGEMPPDVFHLLTAPGKADEQAPET